MWPPSQEQAAQDHQANAPGGITSFLLKTFVVAAFAAIALSFLAGRGIIDAKYDPRALLERAIYKNITADDIPKAKAQAQTVIENIIQGPERTPLPELKQHMLDLTNAERRKAGAPPVRLGSNPAAQLHAEAALEGCYSSHWDRWGLKPNWRYTLTGGTGADGENWSGLDYCAKASENYRSIEGRMLLEVTEAVNWWMNSPGHRRNLLDPAHTLLNIGIAFDKYNEAMVQQFGSDYVSYTARPNLSTRGTLTFGGTVQEATLNIADSANFIITWHPPPKPLTRGQLAHTYSLCNDQTVGLILEPLSGGSFYTKSASIETVPAECVDPYDNDPGLHSPSSNDEAHKAWANAKAASQNSTATRTETTEWITASHWNIQDHSFEVSADVSILTEKYGPGIYSLLIWGRPDHMSESTVISKQAIFWGIDPPEGNPYSPTALVETPAPTPTRGSPALIQFPTTVPPVIIQAATPSPLPLRTNGPTPIVIAAATSTTPILTLPNSASTTPTPMPRYFNWGQENLTTEVPTEWVGAAGIWEFTFGNKEGTAGIEAIAEPWETGTNDHREFIQRRLDELLAKARQALRAGVTNPYDQKSSGPAGDNVTDRFPDAWQTEYLMQETRNECIRDVVEILAPDRDHNRGVRITAWVCQESLDDRRREDREHMLRNFR